MKTQTPKVLIHIRDTYVTRNTLESSVMANIEALNNLMCDTISRAKHLVNEAVENADKQCEQRHRYKSIVLFPWKDQSGIECISIGGILNVEYLPIFENSCEHDFVTCGTRAAKCTKCPLIVEIEPTKIGT